MTVVLWRNRNLRISPVKINNVKKSIVTNFYPLGISKQQITSHNVCRYFSKLHALKFKIAIPGNSFYLKTTPVFRDFVTISCFRSRFWCNMFLVFLALSSWETHNSTFKHTNHVSNESLNRNIIRYYCSTNKQASEAPEKPPSLLQRFKQMYRDYWYVLVPVHLVTSACWFSSFYYLAKRYTIQQTIFCKLSERNFNLFKHCSGVDIASLLEAIGAGEKLVDKLRNSNSTMGYLAIAYALYKIATPIRYTVTLGIFY